MKKKQLDFNLYNGSRGGRRPDSGRKRIHSRGVAHRKREDVSKKTPLHINFKFKTAIRNKDNLKLLKRAIINARSHGLRIIHFSLQYNHVHLIIESENNASLTKGMRSLTVTFAKGLKKGRVQLERYHLHVLRSLRESRNAVNYVLFNQQKHEKGRYTRIDNYSSIFSIDRAINIIKNYAIEKNIFIQMDKSETWNGDKASSFLLKRTLYLLSGVQ